MSDGTFRSNRRDFLDKSALVVGGLSFALAAASKAGGVQPGSAQATGAQGGNSPNQRLGMGLIGCGGMGGNQHLPWFLGQSDVQVRAVCDVDSKHLSTAKAKVDEAYNSSDCATYEDFRELLARDDVDAVLIATPDHWHGLIAAAAAKAGKHIYCEKPLTNTIGEGRAVANAATESNIVFQTGCHERSGPNVAEARKILADGRLGEIHTVRIHLPCTDPHHIQVKETTEPPKIVDVPPELNDDFWLGPAPAAPYTELGRHFIWRFNLAYGGGEMTDRGAHVIDLAHLLLGLDNTGPVEVSARGDEIDIGPLHTFMDFTFENIYPNGLKMIGESTGPRGLRLEGSEGSLFIEVHGGRLSAEPESILEGVPHHDVDAYNLHRREFLDCARSGKQPIAHAEAGHRTATACHVSGIAMRLGRPLRWDPEKERFDDDAANALVSPQMREPWSI